MPNIVLGRDNWLGDRPRKYTVLIDGKIVGKIRAGETIEYPSTEGLHTIQVKIDWAKTQCFHFNLTTENKRFQVNSNLHGWRLLRCVFYAFMPSKWIVLNEINRKNAAEPEGA